MNPKSRLLLIGIAAAIWALSSAAVASASSPTLLSGEASSVTSSSAILHATVNPSANATKYRFEWGLTTAYGAASRIRSAGSGTSAVSVMQGISDLLPGSIYHYRVVASNRFGDASGADRTFKTKGHPPPGATTGAAILIGHRGATVTGVIAPNGEATTYLFQYGLTSGYGSQTFSATVPASSPPVNVSDQLQGLAPGTAFHFRIVALHGGIVSYGTDVMFVTVPRRKQNVHLRASTLPHRKHSGPFVFATTGQLIARRSLVARCSGMVSVAFVHERHRLLFQLVAVQPNCTFAVQSKLGHLRRRLRSQPRLGVRVVVRFHGNPYLAPTRARPERVLIAR